MPRNPKKGLNITKGGPSIDAPSLIQSLNLFELRRGPGGASHEKFHAARVGQVQCLHNGVLAQVLNLFKLLFCSREKLELK